MVPERWPSRAATPTGDRAAGSRYGGGVTTVHKIWLLLHVVSVVVWAGGVNALLLVDARQRRSSEMGAPLRRAEDAEWLSSRVFVPAGALVLVSGLGVADQADIGLGQAWITIGFLLLLAALGAALAISLPALQGAARTTGAVDPDQRVARATLFLRLQAALLLLAIVDMVWRPGG
jgi:hypothetical protein